MSDQTTEEIKPIWVRPARAAKLIGCSLSRVYELMNNHTLSNRKQDGMRLIAYASIERLGAPSSE
jgi:hypothetical protein